MTSGVDFAPKLTAKVNKRVIPSKRKAKHDARTLTESAKRRKIDIIPHLTINVDTDSENDNISGSELTKYSDEDDKEKPALASSLKQSTEGLADAEEDEPVTQDNLRRRIRMADGKMRDVNARLTGALQSKSMHSDNLKRLDNTLTQLQRDKNTFCSLKRSEFSKNTLQKGFRAGLQKLDGGQYQFDCYLIILNFELDDIAKKSPDNFVTVQNRRGEQCSRNEYDLCTDLHKIVRL